MDDTLQVLIVDDEPLARARLRALLGECRAPRAATAGEAGSAVQAVTLAQRAPVDVALLDIHMPGADGMRLARALRELPRAPLVVFVTAHAEHAVQAFELEAADYLTKPVRLERLQAALQKVQRIIQSRRVSGAPNRVEEYLVISERGRVVRVPLTEVLYLKAELKYITVGTAQRQYLLDGSLNQLEEKYAGRFIRIHRNALVARQAIRELVRHDDAEGEGWAVRLTGVEQPLLVSRRQIGALREALAL
ncbi:MAG: LytTR family DNA-binding domain-containing protein [Burkholderiaceae bacterium]|jgi:two-component system response regulator AlgR|nr:LytTR family DNA-binding domain-containing protein [Burkholderiaceae bacterium]